MKLTAYRVSVLVLTNALTAIVAYAFGGAHGMRMERREKNKERDSLSALFKNDRSSMFMPSMMKEDIEAGYFEEKNKP